MKVAILTFILFVAPTTLAQAEWCPKIDGGFPDAVVDLGETKMYYFVDGDSIYDEDGIEAQVLRVKNGAIVDRDISTGYADWFTTIDFAGPRNGFSCDSMSFQFEGAWYIDESGAMKKHLNGWVRVVGSAERPLNCEE